MVDKSTFCLDNSENPNISHPSLLDVRLKIKKTIGLLDLSSFLSHVASSGWDEGGQQA